MPERKWSEREEAVFQEILLDSDLKKLEELANIASNTTAHQDDSKYNKNKYGPYCGMK